MHASPMALDFSGSAEAELFTLEIRESLAGVLDQNYRCEAARGGPGFVTSSVGGRPCWDMMWTRDAGVFLREMAHYGYLDKAVETIRCLFRYVQPNAEGYRTFPMYFKPGENASGTELDGTAAIIIGAVLVWERLQLDDPARAEILGYLTSPDSPVRAFLAEITRGPLVAGSGEFGGGLYVEGEYLNVVQNGLVRLALLSVARLARQAGESALAKECQKAAGRLDRAILTDLRLADGTWLWCRRASDRAIDAEVLAKPYNQAYSGLNGVLSMSADVLGFDPVIMGVEWVSACVSTFLDLLSYPLRLRQFSAHGLWTQFGADTMYQGLLTSPSYGQGYALQCMLLLDRSDLYTKAIDWLAHATCEPLPGQYLDRTSPYHFYERYYSPDAVGRFNLDEGCGALNLVNVMEPLKAARLIVGMDDHDPDQIKLMPRIPRGWTGLSARNLPVYIGGKTARVDLDVASDGEGTVRSIRLQSDVPLPSITLRKGHAKMPAWATYRNILRIDA